MLIKFYLQGILSLLFFAACSAARYDTSQVLYGSELHPVGRYSTDASRELNLIGSACHFSFSFSGKRCDVFAYIKQASGHNYIQYVLDGVYQTRIKITGYAVQDIPFTAATEGTHTLEIYKVTEAQTGPIYIQKIIGQNLHAIAPSETPMIEFIGNSITCGAASDTSEVRCGQGVYHDQHNAYFAYGPRVARALDANYMLCSVSGIGIYRNWNSNGPTMPQVYNKTDLTFDSTQQWNFSMYTPAIVSIALGTNDLSHGDEITKRLPFDSAQFVTHYTDFIKFVKLKYPAARIALLSSPIIHGNDRLVLQNCLTAVKQSVDAIYPFAKPVAVYFFAPINPGGCGGHPSVEDQGKMAEALIPFYKTLL